MLLDCTAPLFQKRIRSRELTKYTDKTITEPELLEADLICFRKQGYAPAPEEAMLGINAIAAPILDKTEAAVAVGVSIQFLPPTPDQKLIEALRECAEQISRRIGYRR